MNVPVTENCECLWYFNKEKTEKHREKISQKRRKKRIQVLKAKDKGKKVEI